MNYEHIMIPYSEVVNGAMGTCLNAMEILSEFYIHCSDTENVYMSTARYTWVYCRGRNGLSMMTQLGSCSIRESYCRVMLAGN